MRRLGQHFLRDTSILKKIASACLIETHDTIIEIGPGHGELTHEFIHYHMHLTIIVIERDKRLARMLAIPNVRVVEGDALEVLPSLVSQLALQGVSYKLVGNIPYYITGLLMRTIEGLDHKPSLCVFTIQKEVAERIVAIPPKMTLLSASVQFWSKPEIIQIVPKSAFEPPPKVDSAVIRLSVGHYNSNISHGYYTLIRALYKQPRKTVLNNLTSLRTRDDALILLQRAHIKPGDRSQNLSLEQIKTLCSIMYNESG